MKKSILIISSIISVCLLHAQVPDSIKKHTSIDLSVVIKNQHYWRGFTAGPAPLITAQIAITGAKSGFEFGAWNGNAFDGGYKEADLYASWTKKGFTFALWDIYNYSDYSNALGSFQFGNYGNKNYFDFSKNSRHFIDASIAYDIPKTALNVYFASVIAGRDRNTTDGTCRYSSYFKTSYGFKTKEGISIEPYVSYGFAFNSKDGGTFWQWTTNATSVSGFNEIGINLKKAVKISNTFSVTTFVGMVASPVNKTVNGVFGITLF